jgi:protein-S-isoprenylcysteine O-methyltransferase Ste14
MLTIVFWVLFLGRSVILMRQGVRVFTLAKGKRFFEKALEMLFAPLLVLWTAQIILTIFGIELFALPRLWVSGIVQWIGIILCFAGLLIFLFALISFGNAWRVGIDDKKSDRLVTNGIFAYSRNPIFLFMNMYFAGVFLTYPNILFLAFFLCFAAGIHMQILNEEKFLRSKFGQEYESYLKKVRRYI